MTPGTVTGRIGTTAGRMVEVVRTPHHVHVEDPAAPHGNGFVLNADQARELAEALIAAVER